jgi:hypothetical protein
MPQLEQVVSAEQIVYKPKKRDSAGRDAQTAASMDLPPRSGSRALYPGSKEHVALGGNAPQPPAISDADMSYAETVAETYAEYPRVLYHASFKRERDAAGKILAGGQVLPTIHADEKNPGYPVPLDVALQHGVKGIQIGGPGSQSIREQHLFKTCFVPLGWNPESPAPIDLELCQKQEAELLAAGWKRTPAELNLPTPKTVEQESDE